MRQPFSSVNQYTQAAVKQHTHNTLKVPNKIKQYEKINNGYPYIVLIMGFRFHGATIQQLVRRYIFLFFLYALFVYMYSFLLRKREREILCINKLFT